MILIVMSWIDRVKQNLLHPSGVVGCSCIVTVDVVFTVDVEVVVVVVLLMVILVVVVMGA